ncbi:MAG: sigma-70 family RNA polymerase sigma factor [Phycisphaerae bacterium]|jgi:RNA polymerase sigma factor for flagellar operon FliA
MRRLVKEDIAAMWATYRATRSTEIRNALVEHFMPLVHKLAEIMSRRLWPRVSADELASAGYDGLINAVSTFDPDRGVKFETYCRQRIVGAIRDWQREIDPLGRSGRNFERSLNAIEDRIQAVRGAPATSDEVAGEMGVSVSKFVRMKRTVTASHCVPLEGPNDRNDDSRVGMLVPADPGPSPVQQTERELIREFLTRGLREQDRMIITLYYYERLTMAEIGAVLGVSESRVCQRHAEIIDQLRSRFASVAFDLVA